MMGTALTGAGMEIFPVKRPIYLQWIVNFMKTNHGNKTDDHINAFLNIKMVQYILWFQNLSKSQAHLQKRTVRFLYLSCLKVSPDMTQCVLGCFHKHITTKLWDILEWYSSVGACESSTRTLVGPKQPVQESQTGTNQTIMWFLLVSLTVRMQSDPTSTRVLNEIYYIVIYNNIFVGISCIPCVCNFFKYLWGRAGGNEDTRSKGVGHLHETSLASHIKPSY